MKDNQKMFLWFVWIVGWIIYAKSLSLNSAATGLGGIAIGALLVFFIFFEYFLVKKILTNKTEIKYGLLFALVYTSGLSVGCILGDYTTIIACSMRLFSVGLLYFLF